MFFLGARHVFGTRLHEALWRRRRLEDCGKGSESMAHRPVLVARVARFAPVGSVLEVGCGTGANLVLLASEAPAARVRRVMGIDVSPRAIAEARRSLSFFSATAHVSVGRAEDLRRFQDHSVDVVLSDAALMYLGPDQIFRALSEMTRVAQKGLVLLEWNLFDPHEQDERSRWHYGHWIHLQGLPHFAAYPSLLRGRPPGQ